MSFGSYTFTALKGRQGKYEYYLIQCPLRLVPRLFLFDEAELPASLRRARSVDPIRAAEIAAYVNAEPEAYVLTPIIATVNGAMTFKPLRGSQGTIGRLSIPLSAQLILQDGQHRRMAIQKLLAESSTIGEHTIPVMLLHDEQFIRASRLYALLNRDQTRKSRSTRVLHEQSDLAVLVQRLIDSVPLFQGRIELEKTTISNRSTALFTLSAVYQANEALLGVHKGEQLDAQKVEQARRFWTELSSIIPEWQQTLRGEISAAQLRQNYVHAHTVMLVALGKAGNSLIHLHSSDWPERMRALGSVDWSRTNTALWEGRAMVLGRMSKATSSIKLSVNAIKHALNLPLTEEEQRLEDLLASK